MTCIKSREITRRLTKVKIVIKQNIYALLIVLIWFGLNLFYFWVTSGDLVRSLEVVFFFVPGEGRYGFFYDSFTEFIIFGLVFSLITVELFRKYNPEITAREVCRKLEDHIVIIGYSNISKRLDKFFEVRGVPHVIIDKNLDVIEDLIDHEEPVIHDDALSMKTLVDAGVEKAKAVFVMADDLEVQMVVNYNIRKLNSDCVIIDRIFQDDIGELISKTYNTIPISTSHYAAENILEHISKRNYKNILIIGMNHISLRLIKHFKYDKEDIKYTVIEEQEEIIEDITGDLNDPHLVMADPKELSTMMKVKISEVDCVLNLIKDVTNSVLIVKRIRELNEKCKIICRIFLESVAEMLEKPPFNCKVISSSRATLETLIKKDILKF